MTTARLPLFPLNAVLFPGLVMPLNVFEERYRALMRDLRKLPEAERRFGVVAIRDGREVAPTGPGLPGQSKRPERGPAAGFGTDPMQALFGVGCVADAATIREKDNGGFEVLVTGTRRFRLLSVDASGEYLTGEVEALPERSGEGAGVLSAAVVRAFRTYQKRLAGARERSLGAATELPDEPSVLSYLVAAAAVLDTPSKQQLLQARDTAARLSAELKILRRETAVLGKLPSLPAVDLTRNPTSPN